MNDYQSMGGFERKNSDPSLYNLQNNGDNQTVNTSVERKMRRGRKKATGIEI